MTEREPNSYLKALLSADGPDGSLLLEQGELLVPYLRKVAAQRGHDLSALSISLGVTAGFISQVENGLRKKSSLSDDFVRACAQYLDVPYLVALILAGRIVTEDALALDKFAGTSMAGAFDFVRELAMGQGGQ